MNKNYVSTLIFSVPNVSESCWTAHRVVMAKSDIDVAMLVLQHHNCCCSRIIIATD